MADEREALEVEGNPLGAGPELVRGVTEGEAPLTMPEVPAGRRAAATFIFLTVALDMVAMGMIAPVLPRLIADFLHGDASSAARMLGLFGTVFAGIQFVFSPVLGSLSDRFGLWLGFHSCNQEDYLAMVVGYAVHLGLSCDSELLEREALEWAITRGARSGRTAWQYIQDLAGRLSKTLD